MAAPERASAMAAPELASATATPELAAAVAAPREAKIWVIMWGSRGDHEPGAALVKALQERGHKARAFGLGRFRRLFDAQAVPFDALDGEMMLHPGNLAARRKLEAMADLEGFAGPDRAEDFLMDGYLMQYEFMARADVQQLVDGMHPDDRASASATRANRFDQLVLCGKGMDEMLERRTHLSGFIRTHAGRSTDADRPKRDAFAAFLRRTARGLERDPFDVLHTLSHVFHNKLRDKLERLAREETTKSEGRWDELLSDAREFVAFFFSWLDKDVEELDQYLDAYWEECAAKVFRFDKLGGRGRRTAETGHVIATRNMAFTFEATPKDERPDIVIAQNVTIPAGLWLRITHGVDIVPWLPQVTFTSLYGALNYYSFFTTHERKYEPPRPAIRYGSLPFLDLFRHDRVLLNMSPLALETCDVSLRHIKACCTGQWVLDSGPAEGGEANGGFFGRSEEQDAVEAFLAAPGEDPPVYFGWGSNPSFIGVGPLANLVVKTLRAVGRRGILMAGASGVEQRHVDAALAREHEGDAAAIETAKARLLWVSSASHSAILHRCACLVHHGGLGTCHSALRSGTPSVVTPKIWDQAGNAKWIQDLGCGLTAELETRAVVAAVSAVLGNEAMRWRAKEVAESMAAERGVAAAVEIIERCVREPGPAYAPPQPPLNDGVFEIHGLSDPPGGALLKRQVKGLQLFEADGRYLGMIRGGVFTLGKDVVCNTEISFMSVENKVVIYGNASVDGRTLNLRNGRRWEWVSDAAHA